MKYRALGKSGLMVSEVSLGTMSFGGVGNHRSIGSIEGKEAADMIDFAIDHGINLLDTADRYSSGHCEEVLGETLNGRRPQNLLISTKCCLPTGTGPNDEGLSRMHIIQSCENSLRRLRTDHIDIYYLHEWDGITPEEEKLEALDTLVKQGKIRYIGCSNWTGWQIMKSLATSRENHLQRFVTQQIHYTLEAREAENELIPIGIDQGLGTLVWSPLAGGLLSGKYTRNQQTLNEGRFSSGWSEPPIRDYDRLWNIVDVLNAIAAEHETTAACIALAWTLTRPTVTSLVLGARKMQYLEDNLKALEISLSEEDMTRLNEVSILPLQYPYWHQAKLAIRRLSPADEYLLKMK